MSEYKEIIQELIAASERNSNSLRTRTACKNGAAAIEALQGETERIKTRMRAKVKYEHGNYYCSACGYPARRLSFAQKKFCDECGAKLLWTKPEQPKEI